MATYSSLKSFLTNRVDQQLDATHDSIVQALYHPGGPPGGPGPGSSQPGPSEPDSGSQPSGSSGGNNPDTGDAASMFQRLAPGTFVALLKPDGTVITQQPYVEEGGTQLEPQDSRSSGLCERDERSQPAVVDVLQHRLHPEGWIVIPG